MIHCLLFTVAACDLALTRRDQRHFYCTDPDCWSFLTCSWGCSSSSGSSLWIAPRLTDHSEAFSWLPECPWSALHSEATQRSAASSWPYHRGRSSSLHLHPCLLSSSVSLTWACSRRSAVDIPEENHAKWRITFFSWKVIDVCWADFGHRHSYLSSRKFRKTYEALQSSLRPGEITWVQFSDLYTGFLFVKGFKSYC